MSWLLKHSTLLRLIEYLRRGLVIGHGRITNIMYRWFSINKILSAKGVDLAGFMVYTGGSMEEKKIETNGSSSSKKKVKTKEMKKMKRKRVHLNI